MTTSATPLLLLPILLLVLHLRPAAASAEHPSSRQLPSPIQIVKLQQCRLPCTADRSVLAFCRRCGCRVLPCNNGRNPKWKCRPPVPYFCSPYALVAPGNIYAGCRNCLSPLVLPFPYAWPTQPDCLVHCIREGLQTACMTKTPSKDSLSDVYSRCCRKCRGVVVKDVCVCDGVPGGDGQCLLPSSEAEE